MQGWGKLLYVLGVRAKKERGGKGRAEKNYETVAQPKETVKQATIRFRTGKFYAQYTPLIQNIREVSANTLASLGRYNDGSRVY